MERVRTVTYTLTARERAVLTLLECAAGIETAAHRVRYEAAREAIACSLPLRMIGASAGYSAAHLSRIGSGQTSS